MRQGFLSHRLFATAFAVLLFITGAGAQAQDHKHDMRGMEMNREKSKPSPTPSPGPASSPAPSPSPEAVPSPAPASTAVPETQDQNTTRETAQPVPATQAPVTDTLKSEPEPSTAPDHAGMSGHDHDAMKHENGAGGTHDMSGMNMNGAGHMNMGPLMMMSGNEMSIRVGASEHNSLPMGQMGSGTSWNPASTPMPMYHRAAGDWLLMLHYNLVAGVNAQGGPRGGATRFESQNWFMPMAFHRLGRGTLQLRGMFSAEPFTFARGGSPLLFQTGETYKGEPLIDKQHPHDLFMELSATYTVALGERGTWFAYFGYPGEPALGPVAFMHRASASENPSAPLSHHMQDSTHISFGVLTTGFTYRWLKLEGSVFNGREPDENRYNFEAHSWNSRSARLSFAPNDNWTMQFSYGFLRRPEALEPLTDLRRATASVQYNRPLARGNWATAFIWGRNHVSGPGDLHNLNGYTFESTLNFLDRNYLYTRLELADKENLLRAEDRAFLGIADEHPLFRIGAFTFGGARDIWNTKDVSLALGSDVTFYSKPDVLDPLYGRNPASLRFFLRLRKSK